MMKKVLYFTLMLLGVVGICSCSSPEDKAKALLKEHMKTVLLHPESYECVSVEVDSAFAPFASPSFHEKVLATEELGESIQKCQRTIESERREVSSAESIMSIYSGGFSDHGRTQYRIYKEQLDEHQRKLDEEIERLNALQRKVASAYDEIKKEASQEPAFIGYSIVHRYRAKNNAGQAVLGDVICVTDKDFSKILVSYDAEGDKFAFLSEMIKRVKEDLGIDK